MNVLVSPATHWTNSTQVNVTMILLQGKHNYTACSNCDSPTPGKSIKDMEIFEMIGNGSAAEVVVYLTTTLNLVNVTRSYFGNLTFMKSPHCDIVDEPVLVRLPGPNTGIPKPRDGKIFVTVVNRTIFNNVFLEQNTEWLSVNFSITVKDSNFTNQSGIVGVSRTTLVELDTGYTRKLEVIQCILSNSNLYIGYDSVNFSIYDSILLSVAISVAVQYGNVIIAGNILFSNFMYIDSQTNSDIISFFSSNITISGNIIFAI